MRSLYLLAALAILATACSDDDDGSATGDTASGDEQAGEILLLSYNVAGLPEEVSDENPAENIPKISPRLEPYDVVLTQEDFDWWQPEIESLDFTNYHDRLRGETTHEHTSDQHPGPEAVGLTEEERPLLLVGDGLGYMSRIPFRDLERVPWNDCFGSADTSDGGAADCLAMKGFAVATFEMGDGVEIDVYNLHAEAGSAEESLRIRAENYEQLAAFMAERSDGRPVIIAGDMNLHLEPDHDRVDIDTPIWEDFLAETGLTDVCDVVECDLPGAIDKAAFRSDAGIEIEPLHQRFAIDDFLDEDDEDLSDHPPLEVLFSWSASD